MERTETAVTPPPPRRALILAGGGMRGAFSAGVVEALAECGLAHFDTAVGVSVSAPTVAYFAAGQLDAIGSIWREHAATPRIVRYRSLLGGGRSRRALFDTDYLVDHVLRTEVPLDLDRLAGSSIECRFVVARMRRSAAPILDAFHHRSPDIWTALKACMALPGVAPAPVSVGPRRYLDGALLDPVPVRWHGRPLAERTLVVLNQPRPAQPSLLGRLILRLLEWLRPAHRVSAAATALRFFSSQRRLRVAEARGEALVVAPPRATPAPLATRSRRRLEDTMALGHEAVLGMRDTIEAFLQPSRLRCAALGS